MRNRTEGTKLLRVHLSNNTKLQTTREQEFLSQHAPCLREVHTQTLRHLVLSYLLFLPLYLSTIPWLACKWQNGRRGGVSSLVCVL